MKKKKEKEEKLYTFLYNHTENIQRCIYLTHFSITFGEVTYQGKKTKARMQTKIDYKYLKSEIQIGNQIKDDWEHKKYNDILETLIHEICHIVIDEIYLCYENIVDKYEKKSDYNYGQFYREKATSRITKWAEEMYQDYMKAYKVQLDNGLEK